MQSIIEKITDKKNILKIDENFVEIFTDVEIEKGINARAFIRKEDGKIYLTDNRNTLRYMSIKYELKAPDVKQCINDVVRHYKFIINRGEIMTELQPSDDVVTRYNDLIICSCTLANMFIFFDDPGTN